MRIWHYFSGYVMIRIEGLSLEKFLNMAAREGISITHAVRLSYTVLQIQVSTYNYLKMKKLMSDKYRITVEKKSGIPFGLRWLVHRPALLVGLVVIAAAAFAASLFVWDIRISGLEYRDALAMRQEIEARGITVGTYKRNIDFKKITTDIIIEHEEIAWLDVNYKGVIVYVDVVLAKPVPELVDEDTPCNIVAAKDAYIESVIALCGRPAVDKGDTVREGDVLISGLIWDEGMPRMLFAARGKVVGNVWYTGTASKSLFKETREKTGKTQIERIITIGKDSASVDGQCRFAEYDTLVLDEYYIGDRLFLPVKVSVLEHSEVNLIKTPAPLDSLKIYLEERAYYEAKSKTDTGVKIVGHKTFFNAEDETLTATVYLQTQEDIGSVVYLEE